MATPPASQQPLLLLPSEKALSAVESQGWTIGTTVKTSGTPGAGNGRFANEAVKAKTVVCVKPMVPMKEIGCLVSLPANTTITFADAADLEKYIYLVGQEGNKELHDRNRVVQEFSHFIWSYDGERGCLNSSTWSVNHAGDFDSGLNLQFFERGGAIVGETLVDLAEGTELFNNYRDFVQPKFYLDYCKENGFEDVRTVVVNTLGEEVGSKAPRTTTASDVHH